MATDDEVFDALLAIRSKLGTIEGKVTLVARADRERILEVLSQVVEKDPLIGQIYLLLDGKRTQQQILEELGKYGVQRSKATISRKMGDMSTEHGIADLVTAGQSKVYRKNREMEDVLNLSKNVRTWLEKASHTVPEQPVKRARKGKK